MKVNYKQIMGSSLLGLGFSLVSGAFSVADAFSISETGASSGGNPGGQPLYKVDIKKTDIGETFKLDWSHSVNRGQSSLSMGAEAFFLVKDFTNESLELDIFLLNTTDLSGYSDKKNNIVSFGFAMNPNGSVNNFNNFTLGTPNQDYGYSNLEEDNVFDKVITGSKAKLPGFQSLEMCFVSDGSKNQCNGGPVKLGLKAQKFDAFNLKISGNFGNNPNQAVSLLDFGLKFQGDWGSYELSGQPDDNVPNDDNLLLEIPEPSTTVGLGLFALGGLRLRHKKKRIK